MLAVEMFHSAHDCVECAIHHQAGHVPLGHPQLLVRRLWMAKFKGHDGSPAQIPRRGNVARVGGKRAPSRAGKRIRRLPTRLLQRVPITWTECHLGGRRPWFNCAVYANGQYCGRRVAKVYQAGDVFACRHCCGLAYASQHEPVRERGIAMARKIRMRLGGGENITAAFPERPKHMHRRTYDRLRRVHDRAYERSLRGLAKSVERMERWLEA
jgi:hypothetical protein